MPLSVKIYIRDREAVQKRLVEIQEEAKQLKLRLKPLNELIAAAGVEKVNGNGKKHAPGPLEFPCTRKGCDRGGDNGFETQGGLSMHMTKIHGTAPKTKRAVR